MRILITFLVVLVCKISFSQNNEILFEHLTNDNGLSHSVINCITQDSRGFIWIGTQKGLNWYDGFEFQTFLHSENQGNSIASNYIHCIYEDSDSIIWIGTDDAGISVLDPHKMRFINISSEKFPQLPSNKIISIFQDKKGIIYIGTDNGLALFDKNHLRFLTLDKHKNEILKNTMVKCFYEDINKSIWIGTNKALHKIDTSGEQIETIFFNHYPEFFDNNEINMIYGDFNNILFLATNKGLIFYDPLKKVFSRDSNPNSENIDFSKLEIVSIKQDKTGNLWMGTFGNGLIKWDNKNGKISKYVNDPIKPSSLSNDYILTLYIDKSGLLWVGTYGGGINKLNMVEINFGKMQVDRTSSNSLISNEIYAIQQDPFYNLWVGTDKGLCYLNKTSGVFETINCRDKRNSIDAKSIYSILSDENGNIWFGTNDKGLFLIKREDIVTKAYNCLNFRITDFDEAFGSGAILSLFLDNDHQLWVGSSSGVAILDTKTLKWTQLKLSKEINSLINDAAVQSIIKDSKQSIWLGTDNGLLCYDKNNKKFKQFLHDGNNIHSLPNNTIYAINEDKLGYIWIGSDAGLSYYDNSKNYFYTFTTSNGLPDNVIYGILIDKENFIWVSTNKGLSKMMRGKELSNYSFVNYNTANWLHSDAFNIGAYHSTNDGILYFGSNEGITYFHPDEIKGNLYVPPVYITQFRLFYEDVEISDGKKTPLNTHISYTNKINLKYNQDILYFEFAALNYIQSQNNNYAFMLENFHDQWIYPQEDKRSVTFTNLDPGEYVLRIKASNNNGIWNNEGATLKIVIKPPFWRTWLFYISVAISLFVWFYLYVHIRTKQLRKQRKILEQRVLERTREVLQQKEALQNALDNLKKTQSQLIDKEKMASLGQLTAGVAHEINNPINFVSGNVAPLERDLEDIFHILNAYENTIATKNLNNSFSEVEQLKNKLDYELIKNEVQSLIRGIKEGANRTAEIVKSLRNFSRIDENNYKYADINSGIESTLLILRNKLKNRIEVITEFGEIPEIMCFPGKINQVFMNIITNAEQAIKGEGKIVIKTWHDESYVYTSISDNGTGMDEETKNRIFEPFYTTKDVGEGTGLGLSISFGIIESHGGKIFVESAPGKGSIFTIKLPITSND